MPTKKIPIEDAVEENCRCVRDLKRNDAAQDVAIAQAQNKASLAAKQQRFVYKLADVPLGFTWERWGPRAGTQTGDLAGFEAQWGGAPVDGIPTHTDGAPTSSGVETDTRYSPSDAGQDEHRLCYWVYNDRAVPIEIQDIDTRAESVRVYAGCDCPSSLVHERYQIGGGTPYHSQGDTFLTLPPGGLVKMTVLIHDAGPDASGFRPVANEVGSEETFLPRTHQERLTVECREITFDVCNPYVPQEGESWKPIPLVCHDCGSAPAVPATVCTGPFVREAPNTSWWSGWSGIITANTGTVTLWDWDELGNVESPGCETDAKFDVDVGNHYLRVRNARAYVWVDWQLEIDGLVVRTVSNEIYRYSDERLTAAEAAAAGRGIPTEIERWGSFTFVREAIAAGATVTINRRVRWNVNGVQANGWVRYIGGLRSNFTAVFLPRQIVEAA